MKKSEGSKQRTDGRDQRSADGREERGETEYFRGEGLLLTKGLVLVSACSGYGKIVEP